LLAPMSTDGRTQQSTTTFKNIKVFDGLSDQQIDDAMMYMRASLGVQCEHCHDDKDWSLDTKEEKRTAREMIRMVRDLNRQLNDDLAVSCYTSRPIQADDVGAASDRASGDGQDSGQASAAISWRHFRRGCPTLSRGERR